MIRWKQARNQVFVLGILPFPSPPFLPLEVGPLRSSEGVLRAL